MRNDIKILDALSQPDNKLSINHLIETCHKIALAYLHFNYRKVFRFLNNEELTIDEFALDAIASMFTRENGEQHIKLKQSFVKWSPPVNSEEDALFFLNKVVCNKVEQHIFSYLREEDPIFSKILDSINHLIKIKGFKKIHSYGKTFIVDSNYDETRLEYIDRFEFEKLPGKLFKEKKILIESLIHYLSNETDFVPAIPLNELVYKIKHTSVSEFITTESSYDSRKQFELNELIEFANSKSVEKLYKSYYEKGKLNKSETDSMHNALKDLCEDLKNGGINPGLYSYLQPYINNLTKEVYRETYHNILEYLFKITKSTIAEKLIEKK